MNAPIAEDLERDLGASGYDPAQDTSERARRNHSHETPVSNTLNGSAQGFMSDLLDAQMRLISAQHQYLYDQDMSKLARAQLDVVTVQTGVLQRLGVFG